MLVANRAGSQFPGSRRQVMDEINRLKSHTPQHVQKHLDHSEKVRAERVVETFKRAVAAKGKEASKAQEATGRSSCRSRTTFASTRPACARAFEAAAPPVPYRNATLTCKSPSSSR